MIIFPFITIFLIGMSIVNLLNKKINLLESLSLGFGIGIGIITFLFFIVSFAGGSINKQFIFLLIVIFSILNIMFLKREYGHLNFKIDLSIVIKNVKYLLILLVALPFIYILIKFKILPLNDLIYNNNIVIIISLFFFLVVFLLRKEQLLIKFLKRLRNLLTEDNLHFYIALIIISLFVTSLIITIYWPISIWDAITLFDSRAKIFLAQGNTILYPDQYSITYLTFYPFLTSSTHFLFNLYGVNNPQFIYSFFYLFLIISFYNLLRKDLAKLNSIFWSLILAVTPVIFHHSTFAYTNLPFVYYYGLGVLYSFYGINYNNKSDKIIGGLLLALATWTRPGLDVFIITNLTIFFIVGIRKKDLSAFLSLLVPYLIINIAWQIYLRNYLKITPLDSLSWLEKLKSILIFDINKIITVVLGFFISMTNFDNYGYIFYLFLSGLLLEFKEIIRSKGLLVLIIVLNMLAWTLLGYGMGLVFNFNEDWRNVFYDSMRRMTMIFIPFYVYILSHLTFSKKIIEG